VEPTDDLLMERQGALLVCSIDRPERGGALRMVMRATIALRLTRALLHDHLAAVLTDTMGDEAMAIELRIRSDDFNEGMRAFAGKRPPEFQGR
jgi:2-(1,2-epoxy-1,2-dihydrophenyl)acetyl-CoA isomerase